MGTSGGIVSNVPNNFDAIQFRNTTAEEVPAFGVMRIVTPGVEMRDDMAVVTIAKANTSSDPVLVNGPQAIPAGGYGSGYKYGILQVKAEAGLTLGQSCRAKNASWEIEDGDGPFVFFGYDTQLNCGIARIGGGGGGGGATLYRFETTAAYTSGTSVTATIKTMAGTTFASGATLKDPEAIFMGMASGTKGYCIAQGGEYFAIQAACNAEEGYV
jgi:hypothetical protein